MYKYPYGDSQQLNLDWILAKLKELEQTGGHGGTDLEEVSNALISLTYNPDTLYARYDYAFRDNKLYRCLTDTTGAFDPDAWQEALIGDDLAVLTRWINAIDAAAVVDVKFDTSGTNGKIQQKYHDQYHDVVEVDYTPVQDSKRPLSSNAGYELNSAINGRINRGAVDISVLTDIWLVTAKDGVYMVTGSSRIGTFVEDADHNFGILTLATAPQTSFDYGYIAFHSTTGRTFYRDFTRANDNISWRTALQKIAIGSEISNLSGAVNDKVSKSGDTMTGALESQTAYVSNGSYSSNQWATEIYFKDANNVNIGQFRTGHMANGDEIVEFFGRRNVSGSDVFNALKLGIHPDGSKYVEFNNSADAAIWRTALDLSYSANDTISITSSFVLNGFVNSNSKIAYFDFVTDKSMENISSISITAMTGYFLGVSGAFEGTSSSSISFADSGYSRSLTKQGNNHVRIGITKSSGYNVTGNTPVSYFGTLSLKFT